ncbi:YchJ family metal-binding protein [Neisseriaceae bacterium ESL0693]|nr:YchJ family metal-binding protein [Neisseriaceae bacterium ESL0693]
MGKKKLKSVTEESCPCGALDSQGHELSFDNCCGRLLTGKETAKTPEQLMRSRYTAYTLNNLEYLKQTWHPDTSPEELLADHQIKWLSLQVLSSKQIEPNVAEVCFIARYKYNGRAEKLQECSRFVQVNGLWVYVNGDIC